MCWLSPRLHVHCRRWDRIRPHRCGEAGLWQGGAFGKVTDKAGKPVANATIQLAGQDFQQAKTDAQGNYNFRTIRAAGQYQIGVEAQGFLPIEYWNGRGTAMQLTPQSQTTRDLVLERGASIVVTVTDAAGEPIKGARVDASPIPVTTVAAACARLRRMIPAWPP